MNSIPSLSLGVPNYTVYAAGPRIPCMEFVLPNKTVRHEEFKKHSEILKFDTFHTYKYLYIMLDSDLDMYEDVITQRVEILILIWRKFYESPWPRDHIAEMSVGKSLLHHTLQVWFSCEWTTCPLKLRISLLNELRKNLCLLPLAEGIDFDAAIGLGSTPWNVPYLREIMDLYTDSMEVDALIPPATSGDILFLIEEGLPLIFNRLMKLFDSRKMYACLNLCLRMLAAWNSQEYQNTRHMITITASSEAACLLHISHIYLMVIYEADNRRGQTIDKIINEVRFFINGFNLIRPTVDEFMPGLSTYTASNYIALTVYQLNMTCEDFFVNFAIQNTAVATPTFFAVLLQSYLSYLLANWLLDYGINHWELNPDLPYFIKVLEVYVETRQQSELYILAEQHKQERQLQSHNLGRILKFMTNFKEQINKGNRCENIIRQDFRSTSDEVIFENLPQHEQLRMHIYNLLIDRPHNVWCMGNVVLLLKIISQRLNEIEIYRYQPGLTTDFMLNLDIKLAKFFENLAVIFENLYLISQECWLTAFYLNPNAEYYRQIQRCGLRILRSVKCEKSTKHVSPARIKHLEQLQLLKKTKYQLISSTIDVHEIVNHTNYAVMDGDYAHLQDVLSKLNLPKACLNDLLTVCFAARSRYFAWAVPWPELQKRCRVFLNKTHKKCRFVEQSMAEANDRLKFLNIDYEKYKHRPMLDYGCIESGYEKDYEKIDTVLEDKDSEPDGSENSDDDYKHETSFRKYVKSEKQKERERNDQLLLELDDSCFKGGRRTRARTASALRSKQQEQSEVKSLIVEQRNEIDIEKDGDNSTSDLMNLLNQRQAFVNNTNGFQAIRDIWNYNTNKATHMELTSTSLEKFKNCLAFFSWSASLIVSDDDNEINECSATSSSDIKVQIERKDTLKNCSDSEGIQTTLNREANADAKEIDNNNCTISMAIQETDSSEIDLPEETNAMEVNLKIYFNKPSDDIQDILKINASDFGFYRDDEANDLIKFDDEISIKSDDSLSVPNEECTMSVELFEDVPTSIDTCNPKMNSNDESLNKVEQNIIQEADESLDKMQQKLKVIMQDITKYEYDDQNFSDDEDAFTGFDENSYDYSCLNNNNKHIGCEAYYYKYDEGGDDEDQEGNDANMEDQDDHEEGDKKKKDEDKIEYEKTKINVDIYKGTNNINDNAVKNAKKDTAHDNDEIIQIELPEAEKCQTNSHANKSISTSNTKSIFPKVQNYFNDLLLGMATFDDSLNETGDDSTDSEAEESNKINIKSIPKENKIIISSLMQNTILEVFEGLTNSNDENYKPDDDETDDKIGSNTEEKNSKEIENDKKQLECQSNIINETYQIATSTSNTKPILSRVLNNFQELLKNIENYDDKNALESKMIETASLPVSSEELDSVSSENNLDTVHLAIPYKNDLTNKADAVPNLGLKANVVCHMGMEPEYEISSSYQKIITTNKRLSASDSSETNSAIKRVKTIYAEDETKEENKNREEENLSIASIDCTSACWQPQVRLQRLQVVQGHVIRNVRVCLKRLNKRSAKKKAVRFAPSSMVYEYIEDDEGVVKRSELLKGCSSASCIDAVEVQKINLDDDDSDDHDEYDDVDDTEYSPSKDFMQPAMSKRRRRQKKPLQKRSYSINSFINTNDIMLDLNDEDTLLVQEQELSSFEEELVLGN